MKKEMKVYIEDILECIDKIEGYTKSISEQDFYENAQIQDAVIRRLEIIGEAVKNIPQDTRERHGEIPMRDILIHEYSGVNLIRIWKAVTRDIPDLKKKIEKINILF